jgi:hypothetical protein
MMRVHYSGGSFLAGTDVATIMLEYSAALANAERAESVDVPAVDVDGNPEIIKMLLGPASQLYAEPVPHSGEAEDAEFVSRTQAALKELRAI